MKSKQQKRDEAAARAAKRAERNPLDQLRHLDSGGFAARKERKRLAAQAKTQYGMDILEN